MTRVAGGGARGRRRTTRATSGDRSRRCRCRRTCRSPPSCRTATDPTRSTIEQRPLRHRAHLRDLRRHDRLRRAIAAAVPRHQQRLAGERSGAGRHHQRLRIADRRGAVRRARRVRRRDDRRRSGAPRVEGLFTGEDLRAFDTLWGDGSAQIVVENSYVDGQATASSATATRRSAPTGCSRSAIRARTAARRSTRASASRGAISTACAMRSASTSIRCRDGCRASFT